MTEQPEVAKTTYARPGLVTFAAVMLIVVGGIGLVMAIEQFSNASWLSDISLGLFGQNLLIWAIIDIIIAIVAIIGGFSIWGGGKFGWWAGMILAVFAIVRWFFLIGFVPVGALIVITMATMIIYGLSSGKEYFDQ